MKDVKKLPASKAPAKSSGHMRDKPTNPIKVDMGKLGKKVC
jgi:hypothetical protein